MDHGIPINKTDLGEHRLGNLIPSCKRCNDKKHYDDYKKFLGDKVEEIERIEAYMARRNYLPLGGNEQIKLVLNQAHEEVRAFAVRYVAIINTALVGVPSAGNSELPTAMAADPRRQFKAR